jgi:hypothetical protein
MESWMISDNTAENTATFMVNTCLNCQRAFDPTLPPLVRPHCIAISAGWAYCVRHYNEGHTPEYDLPEWTPAGCDVKLPK